MPQPNRKLEVVLDDSLREELESVVRSGSVSARQSRYARVLLMADLDRREGRRPDWYIAEQVGISERQVCRIRQRFVREGWDAARQRKTRVDAGTPQKMDGHVEATLITLCCSTPPHGRKRWTLQLLADELCRLEVVASVCVESVRQCLKKSSQTVENETLLYP